MLQGIYRSRSNKVAAGVCTGLATRLGIPVQFVRVLFIKATLVYGLGPVAYLILWRVLPLEPERVVGDPPGVDQISTSRQRSA
jgi:phage shock protein PspC (stress-responsive transcriptional regulator)